MAYTITQRSRITAADGAVLDQFGCSIGLNANTLIVGAQGVDGAGHPYCGAAYIYTRPAIAGVWSLQQKLQETFPAYFEEPLPVPGGYWPYNLPFRRSYKNPYYGCLVGLWQADTAAIAVRLPWDAAWEPLYESWASHYIPMDPFGTGPPGYCGGPWQVITYARAAGVWSQLAIGKLDPLDYYAYTAPANPWPDPSGVPTSIRAFPASVSSLAVGDGIVAAGCIRRGWTESVFSYYGVNSHYGSGAVTVFSGGSEVCCIDDPDKHPGEFVTPWPAYVNYFGSSISICPLTGTTMVIGATKAPIGSGRGRVYVFTGSGGSWSLQQTISPATGSCSEFGTSVAVYGDYLVVGAPTLVRGEVHIYKRTGVVWAEQALLTDAAGARFGSTVGIDKNTVLVGDPMVGAGAYGQISAYYRAGTTWTLVGRKYSTPTGNNEYMTQQGVAALGDGVPTYMAAVQRYSAGANTGAVVEFYVASPGPGYPSITNNSPTGSGVLSNVDLTFRLIDPDLRADLDPTKTRVWVNGAVIYENEVPVSGWFVSRANLADGYAYTLYKAQYEWGAGLNTVRAYGEDYEGNAADRTWTFTVTDRPWVEATYPAAKAPPYTFDVDPATIIQFNAVTSNSTIDNAQTVIMVNGAVVYTGGVAAPGWGVSSVPVGVPGRIGLRYTLTHSVPFVSLSTVTVAVTLKNNAGETIPPSSYPNPPWNPWSFVIMEVFYPPTVPDPGSLGFEVSGQSGVDLASVQIFVGWEDRDEGALVTIRVVAAGGGGGGGGGGVGGGTWSFSGPPRPYPFRIYKFLFDGLHHTDEWDSPIPPNVRELQIFNHSTFIQEWSRSIVDSVETISYAALVAGVFRQGDTVVSSSGARGVVTSTTPTAPTTGTVTLKHIEGVFGVGNTLTSIPGGASATVAATVNSGYAFSLLPPRYTEKWRAL